MKSAERTRVARALRKVEPRLGLHRRMLLMEPIGRVARGVFIEDSSHGDRVYLWALVQPLFYPATTVVLSLGRRLGGGSHTWTVGAVEEAAPDIVREVLAFLGTISAPSDVARWDFLAARADANAQEVKAYSLVAAGEYVSGCLALRAYAASLPPTGQGWMSERRARALDLAELAETDPRGAQARLLTWEIGTRTALGIDDVL